MIGRKRTTWLPILALLVTALSACTGPQPTARSVPSSAVSIADFRTVAGVWEGLLRGMAGPQTQRDWVLMRIGEDGTYEFASFREIGVFHGSGTLRLSDGRLLLEGPRGGHATLTLYADNGRRLLRADGVSDDGRRLTADLTPKP
jgi:hypothetical protein